MYLEGNRTKRTDLSDDTYTVYTWNHRNRLVSVTNFDAEDEQAQKVDYAYDAFNRFVTRTVQVGEGSPTTRHFVYDGTQMTLELDHAGNVAHRLLWGPAVDQIFADENNDQELFWLLTDHQNTVRDVASYDSGTDTTTIANHIAYNSFGQKQSETDDTLNLLSLNYTARYFDATTGLQWNLNRWYNPQLGRWLSEDPIGFAGDDTHLGRYVGNSPTNFVDQDGLAKQYPGTPNQGHWSGTPGDSWFRPTDANGNFIPDSPAVRYIKGEPDYIPWIWKKNGQVGDVEIELDKTMCNDTEKEADIRRSRDRAAAIRKMKELYGKNWSSPPKHAWHHQSVDENGRGRMILVPQKVHNYRYSHWGAFKAHSVKLRAALRIPISPRSGVAGPAAILMIGAGMACGQSLEDILMGGTPLGDSEYYRDPNALEPNDSTWEWVVRRHKEKGDDRQMLYDYMLQHQQFPTKLSQFHRETKIQ